MKRVLSRMFLFLIFCSALFLQSRTMFNAKACIQTNHWTSLECPLMYCMG